MKNAWYAVIFSIAIIVAAAIFSHAFLNRHQSQDAIRVTGLSQVDFTSDLIVWKARFSRQNSELKKAYAMLESDRKAIREYLGQKGIPDSLIVFSAVQTHEMSKAQYENGNYIGSTFTGYELTQFAEINSPDVEKVEMISRQITELINRGIQVISEAPDYYYTGLADLKIQMISDATKDARTRAETIAEQSAASLGTLKSADLGVFQITGQRENEEYSWAGTFNTKNKFKTASVTMRLEFEVND